MKRIITLFLALGLISALALAISAKDPAFEDVDPSSWYYSYVTYAYERGLMEGKSDGVFAPKEPLTRAQYITVLWRMSGAEADSDNSFIDVKDTAWYAPYVGWAIKAGIITGYTDNTFRGTKQVTRQELAVMTARYLEYAWLELPEAEDSGSEFTDSDQIASWAADLVEVMRRTGVLEGDSNGAFNPKDNATRAQIAAMIVRLDDAVQGLGNKRTIAGFDLESFTFYSDYLTSDELSDTADSVSTSIGCVLPVSSEMTSRDFVLGVDGSLQMLQYRLSVKDGQLCIDVSSEYAVYYMDDIINGAFLGKKCFSLDEGDEYFGTYKLDEATDSGSLQFFCESDKNPLSYSVGDSVTFRVSLLSGRKLVSAPYLRYTFTKDDGASVEDILPAHAGQIVFTVKGSEIAGAGHLAVTVHSENKVIMRQLPELSASVIFNLHDIEVAAEKPADFDEFWEAKLAEICAVEPVALEFEVCPQYSNAEYDVYDAKVQTNDLPVYLHITVPKNAEPGSLKIFAFYQHHGRPRAEVPKYHEGCITVCINSHSVGNHMTEEEYLQEHYRVSNYGYYETDREESYFLGMLQRDIQGIRFVESYFADLWNGVDISTNGGSMAGFQSIAVAGIYSKVNYVDVSVPWMCDLGGNVVGYRFDANCPEYNDCNKYFDSAYFAESITCPVSVIASLGDGSSPSSGVIAMYNALKGEKTLSMVQGLGHATVISEFNPAYIIVGDSTDYGTYTTVIADNGCATDAPTYGEGRILSNEELSIKAITDRLAEEVGCVEISYTDASSMSVVTITRALKSALSKIGLDSSCSISTDGYSIDDAIYVFTEINDGEPTKYDSLYYTVKADTGAYYTAAISISFVN